MSFVLIVADKAEHIVNLDAIANVEIHRDGTSTIWKTDGKAILTVDVESTGRLRHLTVDSGLLVG